MSTEVETPVPHYTWGGSYHLDGQRSTILENRVFPALGRLPRESVVGDFGCGEEGMRHQAPHWLHRPYIFQGFDRDEAAVNRYNSVANGCHPDRAELADLTRLDIGKDRFDAGLFWRVLHSIPKDLHEVALGQIADTLKHGASLHVAVRSERDWVAADLQARGVYRSGEMNDCYPAMAQALDPQGITNWPLYFFRAGEVARLGAHVGLAVVHQQPIQEPSGFKELADKPLLSYDYVEFVRS